MLDESAFSAGAGTVGLDKRAFEQCFRRPGPVPAVERDVGVARSLGGDGTPLVIVNGLLLVAERDSSVISRIIAKTTVDR
jgi:hypothetical protein